MKNITPMIFQHAELDGTSFFWEGNSIGILLTHGFTATSVEVRQIATYLYEKGFTVAGPLLSGHGTTIAAMNSVSWRDWVESVEELYQKLAAKCSKVFVLGESMGALLSMEMALAHPQTAGMMLFSPALRVPRLWVADFIWPFKEYIFKSNTDDSMPWQGFNVVPLHAASQLLKLQQHIRREMHRIYLPALIFQGKLDRSIDPMSSVDVLEEISSEDKELVWLEESTHCILLDKQLPEVEELSLEFIQKH